MTENLPAPAPDDFGEFIPLQTAHRQTRIEVRMAHETAWLSRMAMADRISKLDDRLKLYSRWILTHTGQISYDAASRQRRRRKSHWTFRAQAESSERTERAKTQR